MKEIGAVSSEENNEEDLTFARADEGANAVADATSVEMSRVWNIFVGYFKVFECECSLERKNRFIGKSCNITVNDSHAHVTGRDQSSICDVKCKIRDMEPSRPKR